MALVRSSSRKFISILSCRVMSTGEYGSGAGKGGGSGGAIRDAGGSMGKREAAQEERHFKQLQRGLIARIKEEHHKSCLYHGEEIKFHEEAISKHMQSIERHLLLKERLQSNMQRKEEKDNKK